MPSDPTPRTDAADNDATPAAALSRASWANTTDRTARTAKGRAAADARFERIVDPDGILPPDERARRAADARKAHYAEMQRRSVEARRDPLRRIPPAPAPAAPARVDVAAAQLARDLDRWHRERAVNGPCGCQGCVLVATHLDVLSALADG